MDNHELIMRMIEYETDCPRHIQHFMKVYAFSKMIGEMECISPEEQEILETAAIVHDIGIKESRKKYGDSLGKHQELEGPPIAKNMLEQLGYHEKIISRVCYLVGHHHTYSNIDGMDYQILVEADFLVNLYEDQESKESARTVMERLFVTKTAKNICKTMFAL